MSENKEIESLLNRAFVEGWTINIDGLTFTPDYHSKSLTIRANKSYRDEAVARLVELLMAFPHRDCSVTEYTNWIHERNVALSAFDEKETR